ncbi:hypothetical protein H9L19_05105 [Weissella diestrammenae]|uniref:Fungal lipase-type domain-containing protein n=1 Tax=Weissella diestrammenae TaxID=1162633 RepID=A0A7G9T3W8_9LACO|nr:hypothetical protein [Weissella diestrammenae]QNN74793.1 hypothetical protein H9L19_05105 [Weissella diestrammenae]
MLLTQFLNQHKGKLGFATLLVTSGIAIGCFKTESSQPLKLVASDNKTIITHLNASDVQQYHKPLNSKSFVMPDHSEKLTSTFDLKKTFNSSSYTFDLSLAQTLSIADLNSYGSGLSDVTGDGTAENTLQTMGFKDVIGYNYNVASQAQKDSWSTTAYAIGHKDMGLYDAYAVIVRGTPDDDEWIGDWDIRSNQPDTQTIHQGMNKAAEDVEGQLKAYAKNHQQHGGLLTSDSTTLNTKTKIIISGHSRGASVTDILATSLGKQGLDKNNIYAYAFSPARTMTSTALKNNDFNYIWNIIAPADFIPTLGLDQLGLKISGNQVFLPNADDQRVKQALVSYQKTLPKTNSERAFLTSYVKNDRSNLLGNAAASQSFGQYMNTNSKSLLKPLSQSTVDQNFYQTFKPLLTEYLVNTNEPTKNSNDAIRFFNFAMSFMMYHKLNGTLDNGQLETQTPGITKAFNDYIDEKKNVNERHYAAYLGVCDDPNFTNQFGKFDINQHIMQTYQALLAVLK